MKTLCIDLETYASVDLNKCGVYKYAESPDFEILLFGYSADGGKVRTIDLANGEELPEEILSALLDEKVVKWAHNSSFERVCLSAYINRLPETNEAVRCFKTSRRMFLDPKAWRCTMTWAAYLGLPLSLKVVGVVLGLEKQKLEEGKDLIRYFTVPCKPTKSNGGRTRNLPVHDPVKWEKFKDYNIRDVEVEMQIEEKLANYPVPEEVWDEYHLDQEINDRGVLVDIPMVEQAIRIDALCKEKLTERLRELTGVENPNSVIQMKEWLEKAGIDMDSLGKKDVAQMIGETSGAVREVLQLRLQLAKSSVKKYQAMSNAACADGRCRGMFVFYGANRTGRFSGRLVQMQNLARNSMPDLAEARALVRSGNTDALDLLYDDVPDVLSQLVRTALIPAEGMRFFVADFSAIEARVIAWLAGEQWRIDAFKAGKDIYCASASQMFGVPVEKHGVNGHLRQKGKIAELALGYNGSTGALKAMGALEMGLTEDELQPLVDTWRSANPHIVKLWWAIDSAAKRAIKERTSVQVGKILLTYKSGMLFITLPSGRNIAYVKPRIGENRFGGESITYEGVGSTKKWERLETFGGKLVENITQAIARDILLYAMNTLRDYRIVAHVHDEVIIEASSETSLGTICEMMGRVPKWADGLILRADGYICDFYMKD